MNLDPVFFHNGFRGHWFEPSEIITSIQIHDLVEKKVHVSRLLFFLAEAQTSRNFETVLESANISMNILWLKYLKYHFHQDDILVVSSDGARVGSVDGESLCHKI